MFIIFVGIVFSFNRLHQKQDDGNKEQLAVFIEKKALLKTIKKDVDSGVEMTVDVMKKFVSDWRDLGRVPYEMRHIEVKFNKLLDKIVDKTDLDTETIEMIKFEKGYH